jgi:hypothetical protein
MNFKFSALAMALMFTTPLSAELLKDADQLVCVPGPVFHCVADDGCNSELPPAENVPEFISVDLEQKSLSAARSGGEKRVTAVQNQLRAEGYIYLQGVENGRTFSMVISEESGDLSFTVATDGETASMFGSCIAEQAK